MYTSRRLPSAAARRSIAARPSAYASIPLRRLGELTECIPYDNGRSCAVVACCLSVCAWTLRARHTCRWPPDQATCHAVRAQLVPLAAEPCVRPGRTPSIRACPAPTCLGLHLVLREQHAGTPLELTTAAQDMYLPLHAAFLYTDGRLGGVGRELGYQQPIFQQLGPLVGAHHHLLVRGSSLEHELNERIGHG